LRARRLNKSKGIAVIAVIADIAVIGIRSRLNFGIKCHLILLAPHAWMLFGFV